MTETLSELPPLFGNPTFIPVESSLGNFNILFPDINNTRQHVTRILKGVDYRILSINGYDVESIVDVGANIGAFTIYMMIQFPKANCFCFEPSPGAFAYLEQNINTFKQAKAFPFGLYDSDAEMTLYDGAAQGLQNSLFCSAETASIGTKVELRNASQALDEYGPDNISILKVDTEGAEVPIFSTLASRLRTIDQIYVEYHSEKDRRAIDSILADTHVLAGAVSGAVHRGTNHYINTDLVERFPELSSLQINRS